MLLRSAFNALTSIHSRAASLKRPGTPDIFSPARITPSNFFRFLAGPEHTTIRGREFIIPMDSLRGHQATRVTFDTLPVDGVFKLKFGSNETDELNFDVNAATVQMELRAFTGWEVVTVTGSVEDGFFITFIGLSGSPGTPSLEDSTLVDEDDEDVTGTFVGSFVPWTGDRIKKGDRIVDGSKILSIDEVIELHDIGATVMGYRCRCD